MDKKKIPELRFLGFEGEWKEKKLGRILQKARLGGNYKNTDIPTKNVLIKMGNVGRGNMSLDKIEYIPLNEEIDNEDLLKRGDLLFNTRNTLELVGKVSIWDDKIENAYYNSNLLKMEFNINHVSGNFFMNYLFNTQFVLKKLRRIATGTTSVAAIYLKDLEKITFNIPYNIEQEKIASFFILINRKIEKQEEKIKHLEDYKKGMMQKLFPVRGEKEPELRFEGFNGAWEEKRLGECFNERNERSRKGELISVTINDGIKKFVDIGRHDNSSDDKSNYKRVEIGDIAYNSMRMWQGASGYSPYYGILSPAYTVLIAKKGFNALFFSYLFKHPKMIHTFQSRSQGLTSDTWNLKFPALSEIKVFVPLLKEQGKIGNFFTKIDQLIKLNQDKLEELKDLKRGLMQKMFV